MVLDVLLSQQTGNLATTDVFWEDEQTSVQGFDEQKDNRDRAPSITAIIFISLSGFNILFCSMNCTFEANNIEIVSNHKAAGGRYRYQSTTSKFSTYGTDCAKCLLSLCPCNLESDVSGCDHTLPLGSFRDQTQRAIIDWPRTAEGFCVFYCLKLEEPKIQTFSLFFSLSICFVVDMLDIIRNCTMFRGRHFNQRRKKTNVATFSSAI